MKKFLRSLALLPMATLGMVTYSGTNITLESADLAVMSNAVWGFAQTILTNFIAILPYMAIMVVIFFLVKKIPSWLKLGGWARKRR